MSSASEVDSSSSTTASPAAMDGIPADGEVAAPKVAAPLHTMREGETVSFPSESSETVHTVSLKGGVYVCTCTGWRMQRLPVNRRTCKHLRQHLGEEFEAQRCPESIAGSGRGSKKNTPAKKSTQAKKTM